jgi:cytochrome c5
VTRDFSPHSYLRRAGWISASLAFIFALLIFPQKSHGADTVVSGTVKAAEGGSLNGLVMIEKGRLYNKKFKYGGLIKNGRFSVKVDGGGPYGLHLYASGYVYFPLGIRVEGGKDNLGHYKLPPNPANSKAPVLNNFKFTTEKSGTRITVEVSDPNHDLSHQVLALDASTGEAFRMDPPGFVLPFTRTYPEGIYTLFYTHSEKIDPQNWYFVAADNKCYNSPVMGSPFSADGVVNAKTARDSLGGDTVARDTEGTDGDSSFSGREVFTGNCSMCHLADSSKDKVGPGLKGLYSLKKTPVLGNPLTDDVIRKQILEGGKDMPPYSHLTEEEVRAVMDYLKGL